MFADNFGYYDVSAFSDDPTFKATPNIDRLATDCVIDWETTHKQWHISRGILRKG
jgi:hypothetical protein